jgi:hypothetical protein
MTAAERFGCGALRMLDRKPSRLCQIRISKNIVRDSFDWLSAANRKQIHIAQLRTVSQASGRFPETLNR